MTGLFVSNLNCILLQPRPSNCSIHDTCGLRHSSQSTALSRCPIAFEGQMSSGVDPAALCLLFPNEHCSWRHAACKCPAVSWTPSTGGSRPPTSRSIHRKSWKQWLVPPIQSCMSVLGVGPVPMLLRLQQRLMCCCWRPSMLPHAAAGVGSAHCQPG